MTSTHVLISALMSSFWAGAVTLAMLFGLLPVMPWLIVTVWVLVFCAGIFACSLCIIRHDCD